MSGLLRSSGDLRSSSRRSGAATRVIIEREGRERKRCRRGALKTVASTPRRAIRFLFSDDASSGCGRTQRASGRDGLALFAASSLPDEESTLWARTKLVI